MITERIDNITAIAPRYASVTPPCPKSVKIGLTGRCFDHDGRFDMGDLTTTPFIEAWRSRPFQDLRAANPRRDVTGTACETCIAYS